MVELKIITYTGKNIDEIVSFLETHCSKSSFTTSELDKLNTCLLFKTGDIYTRLNVGQSLIKKEGVSEPFLYDFNKWVSSNILETVNTYNVFLKDYL